jgi:hypothetical protein
LRYLIGFVFIGFLILGPGLVTVSVSVSPIWLACLYIAVALGVAVVGCQYCYRRHSDPTHFFSHFIAVAFVVALRFIVVTAFVASLVALGVVAVSTLVLNTGAARQLSSIPSLGPVTLALVLVATPVAFQGLYLWRVGVHLGRIRKLVPQAA